MPFFGLLSVAFTGGAIGGLLNSLVVWQFGEQGINQRMGVMFAPPLTLPWLYQRVAWGGLWGLLFVLPFLRKQSVVIRGAFVSLAPTLFQWFYVFPMSGHGIAGTDLGLLTPALVFFFNLIWGVAASYWVRRAVLYARLG